MCVVGAKAEAFFTKLKGVNVIAAAHYSDKNKEASIKSIAGAVTVMLEKFTKGELDRIYLNSNHFESTIKQNQYNKHYCQFKMSLLKKKKKANKAQASKGHWIIFTSEI